MVVEEEDRQPRNEEIVHPTNGGTHLITEVRLRIVPITAVHLPVTQIIVDHLLATVVHL
jgi:hypothetical protein